MRALTCLAVLATLALAGCGGDDAGSGAPITSSQLAAGFAQRTGAALVASDETPSYDRLALDEADAEPTDRFGSFSLYVLERDPDLNFARLTTSTNGDFAKQTYAAPDAQGIVWGRRCFRHSGFCAYTATKRFADNVMLVWNASRPRTTDARWRQLSAVLISVIEKPPPVQSPASETATAPNASQPVTTTTTAPASQGEAIAASRVIAALQRQGNVRLDRDDEDPDWVVLSLAALRGAKVTAAGARLIDRLGAFTVYVLKGDLDAGFRRLSQPPPGDDLTRSAEPPDAEGIIWTKTCYIAAGCSYSATKRFGAGLVLVWQAGPSKETDSRWDRLAAILTGVSR